MSYDDSTTGGPLPRRSALKATTRWVTQTVTPPAHVTSNTRPVNREYKATRPFQSRARQPAAAKATQARPKRIVLTAHKGNDPREEGRRVRDEFDGQSAPRRSTATSVTMRSLRAARKVQMDSDRCHM